MNMDIASTGGQEGIFLHPANRRYTLSEIHWKINRIISPHAPDLATAFFPLWRDTGIHAQ